ncbi:MAG: signal peptide peptidase SppA [Candidatus Pacearchaeota archaeon]
MKKRFGNVKDSALEAEKHKKHKHVLLVILIILIAIIAILLAMLIKPYPANVALISIEGTILTGSEEFSPGVVFSDSIIKNIEEAKKNKNIKAIIFEINSPGGSAVASQEIAEAIKKVNKEKLTVAVIREIGTSGAYWIASSCNYIIASPMSITGSIGVIASYLEYSGLLQRLNITYQRLVAGKYKDIGSPYKNLSEEERMLLQAILDSVYNSFVYEIKTNRNLTQEQAEEIANGMFYLGLQAKELGLVDALGSKEDAIKYIEEQKGIKAYVREFKRRPGFFLYNEMSAAAYWLGRGIASGLLGIEELKLKV